MRNGYYFKMVEVDVNRITSFKTALGCCAALATWVGLSAASVSWAHTPHSDEHRQHGAHVHGELALSIAIVERDIMMTWQVPAGDVVGFEHPPENTEQRQKIERQLAWIESAQWLHFEGIDACTLNTASATSDQLQDGASGHNDIEATFEWRCPNPLQLSELTIDIHQRYPAISKIRYEWLTERQAGTGTVASSLGTITVR